TYKQGYGDHVTSETAKTSAAGLVGPFIDVYPNPKQGFHFQAAIGFTSVTPGKSNTIITHDVTGGGFGAMAGLGIEGWIGDEWSMGVLARVMYLSAKLVDQDNKDIKADFIGLTPGLLWTTTFH